MTPLLGYDQSLRWRKTKGPFPGSSPFGESHITHSGLYHNGFHNDNAFPLKSLKPEKVLWSESVCDASAFLTTNVSGSLPSLMSHYTWSVSHNIAYPYIVVALPAI